jgi:hypothetical protein
VSSSEEGAGFAEAMTAAGKGAGTAIGLLRVCPGIVCAMRARSSLWRALLGGASALITSPLITTAGVSG